MIIIHAFLAALLALPAPRHTADLAGRIDSLPSCRQDLEALNLKVQADYAGFLLEIRGTRRSAFEGMLARRRAEADRATGASCYRVLKAFTDFFEDPHLFIYQSTRLDTAETLRRARAAERLPLTEDEARAWYARHRTDLDPIEGIWRDRGLRVAVIRQPENQRRRFAAVVLTADTANWAPGMVRAWLERDGSGGYQGMLRERNFAEREVQPLLAKRVLLQLAPGMWGKELPVDPQDSGLVDPADAHRPTIVERDGAVVISIPSHDPGYAPALDSLVRQHRETLRQTPRLIVDLRGNEGGSSFMTAPLMPYILSDSQRPPYFPDRSHFPDRGKGMMLSSPDQFSYVFRSMMGGDSSDPSAKRFLHRLLDHSGELVPFADTLDPPSAPQKDSVVPGPRRVGILFDHATVSAGEAFIVSALRSTRVTTFGEATAGALDYQSVHIVPIDPGEKRWYVGYPTITAQPDLPRDGIRGKGIRPMVPLDLAHERDPIARVARALAKGD